MNNAEPVESKFKELFREQPLLVRSPGRVNLIGEHTDYNDGFVLPGAIDKAIFFAVAPRSDRTCTLLALDLNERHEFTLDEIVASPKRWPNYLMGVTDQLLKNRGALKGFNCVFGGNIPIGAGLSSSAALEAGLAFSLNHLFDLAIEPLDLVKYAQKAENEFVGVQCGIMDQYINIFGREDTALRIDCRSLEYEEYPCDADVAVVLFDTRVSHSLAASEYNRRREECAEGVTIARGVFKDITQLRDLTPEMLERCAPKMSPVIRRRCKYVVDENNRVLKACAALASGDMAAFGQYMFRTHEGLRSEYEVSCPELDHLVEIVRNHPAVFGARMMGGGFGGCTINLVKKEAVQEVGEMVVRKYRSTFSKDPLMYVTSIGPGTSVITVDETARD